MCIRDRYTGDSALVTTGTIASGTWQGTAVADAYVANDLTIASGTVNNTVVGGSQPAAGTFTQVDITGTGDLRLQDTTGGQYVAHYKHPEQYLLHGQQHFLEQLVLVVKHCEHRMVVVL